MTTSHLTWLTALFDQGQLLRRLTPQQASFARLMSPGRCPRLLHDVLLWNSMYDAKSWGGGARKIPVSVFRGRNINKGVNSRQNRPALVFPLSTLFFQQYFHQDQDVRHNAGRRSGGWVHLFIHSFIFYKIRWKSESWKNVRRPTSYACGEKQKRRTSNF